MTHPDFPSTGLPQQPQTPAFPAPSLEQTAADLKPDEIRATRKVLFALDDLENEKTSEPFVFSYQGKTFELKDPKDCDWQDLLVVQEDPRLTLHVLMDEEMRAEFLELKLPMRKFEALLKRWQQHFNQPAPGEGDGSATS